VEITRTPDCERDHDHDAQLRPPAHLRLGPARDTVRGAMDDDLTRLCQSCGLCCDGSLFGRVGLQGDDVERARRGRLRVLESGNAFEQPCSALTGHEAGIDGRRRCSIYDERPRSCRRFVCRLYDRHRREGGPLEPRLTAVRRVRELLADIEGSRPGPADLEGDGGVDAPEGQAVPESPALVDLMRRLEEDFARA
jgi:Putative zinc- or iron-chelating domain